jgi:transcriptional regulator with XRE-family HTH domain
VPPDALYDEDSSSISPSPDPLLLAAGSALRRARIGSRMSQQFLGVLLGTTQQTVSRWEQGLGAPEVPTRHALEEILGLAADVWGRARVAHLTS